MIFRHRRSRCVLELLLGFVTCSLILLLWQIDRFENNEIYNSTKSLAQPLNYSKYLGEKQNRRNVSAETGHPTSPSLASKRSLFSIRYEQALKSRNHSLKLVKDVYEGGHIIANADVCPNSGRNLQLMTLIISPPTNLEVRMIIRQTWGYYAQRSNIGVAFLLGISSEKKENDRIHLEMDMYKDIVQSNLVDTNNNLTLKTVSMLEWIDRYCSEVPFVLKCNDDAFVNVPNLVEFVKKKRGVQRAILGKIYKHGDPVRDETNKYYISYDEYPLSVYPDYVDGPTYLVTGDAVHDLFLASLNTTYVNHIEDVFLSGIVADKVGVELVNTDSVFRNLDIFNNTCLMRKSISNSQLSSQELRFSWEKLYDRSIVCH